MTFTSQTDQPISGFDGDNRYLSNFHPSPVKFESIEYDTVEHAFQAAKTVNHGERILIAGEPTPGKAKRAGRKLTLRNDWEDIKFGVMKTLVAITFTTSPDLALKLLATGNRPLIESNNWGDTVWGQVDGKGSNWLGLILIEVRGEIRALERAFESQQFNGEELF